METNKNDFPAFSCVAYDNNGGGHYEQGLTKREYTAIHLMPSLLSEADISNNRIEWLESNMERLCQIAVKTADLLLSELNNKSI
jgi:hypothetical protein